MNLWKIGLETILKETEDRFARVNKYIEDTDGKVKYDEAMDLLRDIIVEIEKCAIVIRR